MDSIEELHQRILRCTLCEKAGLIAQAAPVVAPGGGSGIMLIGQAPGITELAVRRPFAGASGKILFRWVERIGISEQEFRDRVYMTAITKCFPGKAVGGSGDRRPSGREIAMCRPYLDEQLRLVAPSVLLLVGGLAIETFCPKAPLSELIGRTIVSDEIEMIPLPHPSGASRWLNDASNRKLLDLALEHVKIAWERLVGGSSWWLLR